MIAEVGVLDSLPHKLSAECCWEMSQIGIVLLFL